jgi:hypothetical protein
MLFHHFLARLQNISLDDSEENDSFMSRITEKEAGDTVSPALRVMVEFLTLLYIVATI